MSISPKRRVDLGPTGDTVRANIAEIRKARPATLRQLAERLEGTDTPLSHTTLSQIENGARRVTVDDLMAIAAALDVSPARLLMPPAAAAEEPVTTTGFGEISARKVWDCLTARRGLSDDGIDLDWVVRSRPRWAADDEGRETAAMHKLMKELLQRGSRGDD